MVKINIQKQKIWLKFNFKIVFEFEELFDLKRNELINFIAIFNCEKLDNIMAIIMIILKLYSIDARAIYQYAKNNKVKGRPIIKGINNLIGKIIISGINWSWRNLCNEEVWKFLLIKLANKKIKKLINEKFNKKKNIDCIDSIDCMPIAEIINPILLIEKNIQINLRCFSLKSL